MASWDEQIAPLAPSGSGSTSTRDAGDAGSPPPAGTGAAGPDNPSGSARSSEPAASRSLPPVVVEAFRLVDQITALGLGRPIIPTLLGTSRAEFDQLPGNATCYRSDSQYASSGWFWSRTVWRPGSAEALSFVCAEPPAGWRPPSDDDEAAS